MAWLSILKLIPWMDVIYNAPALAKNAKKFWKAVARETSAMPSVQATANTGAKEDETLYALQTQVHSMQTAVLHLQQQMLESSQLMKTLADQNAQLARRVLFSRIALLCITAVLALLAIAIALKL